MSRLLRFRRAIVAAVALVLLVAATARAQIAAVSDAVTADFSRDRYASATINLAGTWSGTVQFEATVDATSWFSLNVIVVSNPGYRQGGVLSFTGAVTEGAVLIGTAVSPSLVATLQAAQKTYWGF